MIMLWGMGSPESRHPHGLYTRDLRCQLSDFVVFVWHFHFGKIRNPIFKNTRESLQPANVDLDYPIRKSQQKDPSPAATAATGQDVLCSCFSNPTHGLIHLTPHREGNHWVRRWGLMWWEKKCFSCSFPPFKCIRLIKNMLDYDFGLEPLK